MARSASVLQAPQLLASGSGATRNGTMLPLQQVAAGSLSLLVETTIVTGSLVATFKPQVSLDNSTWYDVKPSNNAAFVTFTATGSACLTLPDLTGWNFFRVQATLTGASVSAGDLTAARYLYRKFGST